MKRIFLLTAVFILVKQSFSQPAGDYFDINNIKTYIHSSGDLFWDLAGTPLHEVPKGGGVGTLFAGALWIGGIDNNGQLHMAAHTYRQSGLDFWPGPVMSSGSYSPLQDSLWNRVWTLNKSTVDSFIQGHFSQVPQAILDWPGNGDIGLGQASGLAPFIDLNANGIYEPMLGDYPVVYGDQQLYFIYNDDRDVHTETGGQKMGIEIHGAAYGFDCPVDSAIWNTLFFRYNIFNRSNSTYSNVKLGIFTDFDLGYYNDDFIGSDSTRNMFYCYNGNDSDVVDSSHYLPPYPPPIPPAYGASPPAQGVVFLNHPMTNFMYFDNDFSPYGIPIDADQHFGYMNNIWKNGSPVTIGQSGHTGTIPTNFFYHGDPVTQNGWSELTVGNEPSDRRGVGSIALGTFQPGEMKTIDVAYVFGRDYNGTNLTSLTELRQRVQTIHSYYQNGTTPCGSMPPISVGEVGFENAKLVLYPNPAMDFLTIRMDIDDDASYEMFNILGESVAVGKLVRGRADISLPGVANGVYVVRVKTQRGKVSRLFVKS